MKINNLLAQLGLKNPEDKIYLSLLKLRQAGISQLSRDTGLYRPTLYRALPTLIEKNLVSQSKSGKRTVYVAENPTNLQNLLKDVQGELEKNLPELTRMFESSQDRPVIRILEGKSSIRHLYDEMIKANKKGDATYRYESPRDYRLNADYYSENYWRETARPDAELDKFVITNEATHERRTKRLNRHSKPVPSSYDSFDYNITQLIYNDTVTFIDFDTETATVIESKRFADFQLRLFKLLFRKL